LLLFIFVYIIIYYSYQTYIEIFDSNIFRLVVRMARPRWSPGYWPRITQASICIWFVSCFYILDSTILSISTRVKPICYTAALRCAPRALDPAAQKAR